MNNIKKVFKFAILIITLQTIAWADEEPYTHNVVATSILYSKLAGPELLVTYIRSTDHYGDGYGIAMEGGLYAAKATLMYGGGDVSARENDSTNVITISRIDVYGYGGITYYKPYDNDLHYIGASGVLMPLGFMSFGLGIYYPMVKESEEAKFRWDFSLGLSHVFFF